MKRFFTILRVLFFGVCLPVVCFSQVRQVHKYPVWLKSGKEVSQSCLKDSCITIEQLEFKLSDDLSRGLKGAIDSVIIKSDFKNYALTIFYINNALYAQLVSIEDEAAFLERMDSCAILHGAVFTRTCERDFFIYVISPVDEQYSRWITQHFEAKDSIMLEKEFVRLQNNEFLRLSCEQTNDSFDDLTLEYDGNKLVGVTDNAQADSYWGEIPQVPLGEWDDAMEYDLCGRLVRDDTRGVTAVDYTPGGLPQAFHFEGGDRYNSVFTADGVRRGDQTWHPYVEYVMRYDPATGDSVPMPRNRVASASRRFVGGMTMVDGHASRFDNEAGFVTLHGDSAAYHYVFTDRLGSLRAVVNDNGQVEQWVDYHSGGLPSTTATAPMLDDRLHALKPWAAFHGLALYDNAARWHDPVFCRFLSPDPLAHKAPHLSPFAHCANNALNLLDPTGMKIKVPVEDQDFLISTLKNVLGVYSDIFYFDKDGFLIYNQTQTIDDQSVAEIVGGIKTIIDQQEETLIIYDKPLDKKVDELDDSYTPHKEGGEGTLLIGEISGIDKNYVLIDSHVNGLSIMTKSQLLGGLEIPVHFESSKDDLLFHGLGHVLYKGQSQDKVVDFHNVARSLLHLSPLPYYHDHYETDY